VIALALAADHSPRVAHVIAVNPYDYGHWGGIRRSSPLANVAFTTMLWPGIGPVVARSTPRVILKPILAGGLHDPSRLPESLVDTLQRSGRRPGHARAFRSLQKSWRTWIEARTRYAAIRTPVTLVYGSDDWSTRDERAANAQLIPGARLVTVDDCGHFASLEKPDRIRQLVQQAAT
jgi:pimeloyl-ACP methyl ester carboxylesterase